MEHYHTHGADFSCQFENAATKAARTILFPLAGSSDDHTEAAAESIPKVQITLRSGLNMLQFRDLTANTMNKLVRIPGIVISASVLSSRATKLHLQCRACRSPKLIYPSGGMGGVGGGSDRGLPRTCEAEAIDGQKNDCPMDPYLIIHSKSTFADQQTLKLQEAPDMVPVGELPRHMLLSADRFLTGKVVPGSRVIATGIYSTFQSARNVRNVCIIRKYWSSVLVTRKTLAPPLFANLTSALFILSCLRHRLVVLVVRIPSAYSLHLKKRRSLVRWREAKAFMSASRKVLAQAFTGALVCNAVLSAFPS